MNLKVGDFIERILRVNPLIFIILFVLNILVSTGLLGVDEELLVCFTILIVFFTLTEVLKEEFTNSVALNCISIWEFVNYELKSIIDVYTKVKKQTLYYIILKFKYKFWSLWAKFMIHNIYISSMVTLTFIYKKFMDLYFINVLYKFYYIESLVNMNLYENIFYFSKNKVESEISLDSKMITKL